MHQTRRHLIQAGILAALPYSTTLMANGSLATIKVGCLHAPAVDSQILVGMQLGAFAKQGIHLEIQVFNTGLEISQALESGAIDVGCMGAVISNFPARGQGKVFLINSIEYATAQLWSNETIKNIAQLKGQKISTTKGTTAHVFLDKALRSAKLDPNKDVTIVDQKMSEAVTSFIFGQVSAVALWVPFDITVRQRVPNSRKLIDASAFYPQTAVLGGWVANADYIEKNRAKVLALARAWVEANDYLVTQNDAAVTALQAEHYRQVPLNEFKEQCRASKLSLAKEWRQRYNDGTVTKWLQQVSDFFVKNSSINNPIAAKEYFDASILNEALGAEPKSGAANKRGG